MFIGHYGLALGVKALVPALPLSGVMLSTQLIDVAWASLILTGVEKMRLTRGFTATNDLDLYYFPYSHGLLTSLVGSLLVGLLTWFLAPGLGVGAAVVMGAVYWSHWWLDLLVHPRDLPLFADRYKVGFGLWNYRSLTLVIELALLVGGAALYMATLPANGGMFWFVAGLSLALAALHINSIFGPPPASVRGFATEALTAYLVIAAICFGAERLWPGN
jgi:ABC-type phosphate transport system permease subunit